MMVLQGKPRQSLLYEFGELSGPYPLYSSLLSNHAAQQQKETLMLKGVALKLTPAIWSR